ncbi:TusE/DsrC/DsvC family sulfur relay protein [Biformimicrobium ophioploci]|uniref:TusE/DsrC/DsvC family sulfur relay protein n=1 Tax=Biformimicrobium ophioploci TaxID=3036711 RepID=UPI00255257B9|nr:TusE/DsrC/DsvC family sulfur relay protein [Microbulbifer sp. NKW57]
MADLVVNGEEIELDEEGYLVHLSDWSPDAARLLADREEIALSDAHWEIIELLRDFYQTYDLSPAMRPLVKWIGKHLGPDKGRSIYLMQLFPPSPAKIASKIAGLPKPTNCL